VKDYDRTASRANELQTRLREADAARVPAKDLQTPRSTLAEARQALQEASAAITAGKFRGGLEIAHRSTRKARWRHGAHGEDSAAPARKKSAPDLEGRSLDDELRPACEEQAVAVHSTRCDPPGETTCTSRAAPP
jgi:hypothetical protein